MTKKEEKFRKNNNIKTRKEKGQKGRSEDQTHQSKGLYKKQKTYHNKTINNHVISCYDTGFL